MIIWKFSFKIKERSLTGKKPPDDITVKAKFNELKDLIEDKLKIIKIINVKPEYSEKIFIACLYISELSKDM
tara:strand:+ start:248 stop:463 length:216 start_codon:yes stop_codon:yes gene_type:complete